MLDLRGNAQNFRLHQYTGRYLSFYDFSWGRVIDWLIHVTSYDVFIKNLDHWIYFLQVWLQKSSKNSSCSKCCRIYEKLSIYCDASDTYVMSKIKRCNLTLNFIQDLVVEAWSETSENIPSRNKTMLVRMICFKERYLRKIGFVPFTLALLHLSDIPCFTM